MERRWGLGPVFASELLTSARRWHVYAGRSVFVSALLLALASVWVSHAAGSRVTTLADAAQIGRGFFGAIVLTELVVVLMAAPAATAGGICQEKARGNLDLLLITDLSGAEIVLGKLAARVVPMLGLVGCTLPVLSLIALLGGIDPLALAASCLVTAVLAILGCTVALVLSVWGSKPYEVLLVAYAVDTIWLLAVPVWEFLVWIRGIPRPPRWAIASNPLILAFAPYSRPGTVGLEDYAGFTASCLVVSGLLAGLAIGRIRAVARAQADRPAVRGHGRRPWRPLGSGAGPALDRDPLGWYEWHRRRPSPWIRTLGVLYAALAVGFTALAIEDSLRPTTPAPGLLPAYVNAFQVVFGLPLLLVAATTALVEERSRRSLDVLLTTPLSTRRIVVAKWWSVFRRLPWFLVLPATVAALSAWNRGHWSLALLFVFYLVSAGAAWTSIGLALSLRVPRLGRAVSAAVGLYAFVSLAWAVLVLTEVGNTALGVGLSQVSPFYGPFYFTYGITWPGYIDNQIEWGLCWTLANTAIAILVLLATLATCDRYLGRVSKRTDRARRQ